MSHDTLVHQLGMTAVLAEHVLAVIAWVIGIPHLGHPRTMGTLDHTFETITGDNPQTLDLTCMSLAAQGTDSDPVTSSLLADCQTCRLLNGHHSYLPDSPESIVPNIHSSLSRAVHVGPGPFPVVASIRPATDIARLCPKYSHCHLQTIRSSGQENPPQTAMSRPG